MISDLDVLLRSLEPVLHDGVYVYTSVPPGGALPDCVAMVREAEGVTLILPEADALRLGLPVLFRAAWITLTVHSDLQAVGLTAAVAAALTDAGISCNVVAGAYHDHLFVPFERGGDAMCSLTDLHVGNPQTKGLSRG